jgi:hypothetical protein
MTVYLTKIQLITSFIFTNYSIEKQNILDVVCSIVFENRMGWYVENTQHFSTDWLNAVFHIFTFQYLIGGDKFFRMMFVSNKLIN